MGESANLAFYAIVYAKGMVPKAKLDQAMMKSVAEGSALEQVLVQANALKPGDLEDLLKVRSRLGRHCSKCGNQTYLLQDQNEQNTECEEDKCKGRLLTLQEWTASQAKARPAAAARPTGATATAAGADGAAVAALERRLGRLEDALTTALKGLSVNTDDKALARAAEHAEKVLGPKVDAARKEAAQAATAAKEAVARATSAVAEGLGVGDLGDLAGHLTEQLTPRVVQALRGRLDEVASLGERLTSLEAGAEKRGAGLSESAVAAQVKGAVDGLADKIAAQVLKRVPPAPDEGALAERVAEKVLEAVPPPVDAEALAQRVTRAALSAAEERFAARFAELVDPKTASAEAVAPLEARLAEVEARAGGTPPEVEERLADVEGRAEREGLALGKRLARLEETQATAASTAPVAAGASEELLEKKLAETEERIGAASAEVLEALNGRVDDLSKSIEAASARLEGMSRSIDPAKVAKEASKEAVAAVKDRLDQLDDPRDLMSRAAAQAVKDVMAAVEKKLAAFQPPAPAQAAASAPVVDAGTKAEVGKLAGEVESLRESLELIQARMDAQRARQQGPSSDDLVAKVQEGVLATVGERMLALEARLAEAAQQGGGGGGAPAGGSTDASAVVQQAVQAVWDQLDPLDLPGLPARVTESVTKQVMAQLDENIAGLPERLAASAAAPVMASIETRLAKLDLKNLPKKIAADVKAELAAAGGGGGQAVDEELLAARILEQVDAKIHAKVPAGSGAAPPAVDEEALTARLLEQLDAGIDAKLPASGNGGGGGLDADQVREIAREIAREVIAEQGGVASAGVVTTGGGEGGEGGGGGGGDGKTEKRFAAMARALKELKDDFEGVRTQVGEMAERPSVGVAVDAPKSGPVPKELLAFLNSVEFKETFDRRINEVLRYIKNDLVPSAVKKAVDAASAAGSS